MFLLAGSVEISTGRHEMVKTISSSFSTSDISNNITVSQPQSRATVPVNDSLPTLEIHLVSAQVEVLVREHLGDLLKEGLQNQVGLLRNGN
jgi:hypothetical protein